MSTNDEKKEKVDKAAGFLTGIFTGWGIPANWAKVIAGAIIGALVAAGVITGTGCTHAELTPQQVQQAQETAMLLHEAIHKATGEPCIFVVEDIKK